jgi:Homeodomain-like domain-containing protein
VSVIDELRGLEERVAKRMQELRPLVDEYHELEQYAQRLGVPPTDGADPSAPPPRSARRSRSTRKSAATTRTTGAARTAGAARASDSGRDPRDGRREQLLSMVKARPGITVREVGTALGVDPTSLYRIVHRLEKEGALQKRGRELLPG